MIKVDIRDDPINIMIKGKFHKKNESKNYRWPKHSRIYMEGGGELVHEVGNSFVN